LKDLSQSLPETFQGFPLEEGVFGAPGLTLETLESLLIRTIGRISAPKTAADWLEIPEEDIMHVINGEVWEDAPGSFTGIRKVFQDYYPNLVWKRRVAHWCRYASGMGLYPIRRALLRDNLLYATTAFGRTLKLTVELTFLLNRTYFPYDKWLYTMFKTLPKVASEMLPLIDKSLQSDCSFEDRIVLLERMHKLLDHEMVALGLIQEHPEFVPSETSGYRLLEHAYHDLLAHLPEDVRGIVPLWDQKFLESDHASSIAELESKTWDNMLNLKEKK
jgi:hypothetical protein